MRKFLTDFAVGIVVGFLTAAIFCGVIAGLVYNRNKNKELLEYVELQQAIEELREDYTNRDPFKLLDDIPGVRGAADGASAEFDRKLDEILQRFRHRFAD